MLRRLRYLPWALLVFLVGLNCSDEDTDKKQDAVQQQGCLPLCFEPGGDDGHADPMGAKAAQQARAGRITDAAQIIVGEDARQKPKVGDFLLINDKIAIYVEDKGVSDGYARFGGEILAVDRVGEDGRPMGMSKYGETLMAISKEMIDPEAISVLNDGSDGKAAVLRVMGHLKPIPFLGSLGALFPREYGLLAIHDYILEPGSERLKIRLGLKNDTPEDVDLKFDEMHGFFHSSKSKLVTQEFGYAEPKGKVNWAGFDGGDWSFAWRLPGQQMEYAVSISGFQYFTGGGGKVVPANKEAFFDYVELIAGGPHLDGLREAIRRVDGEPPWQEIKGTVTEEGGGPVEGAYVHLVGDDGTYLSRTLSDAQGNYTIHAPPGVGAKLIPSKAGYPIQAGVASSGSGALTFAQTATLVIKATEEKSGTPLPVRVQVIPETDPGEPSAAWGDERPANGRSHVFFAINGEATLPVPPGKHRVVVSRGYEWELLDQSITAEAGKQINVDAKLNHSVDSTGVMCADFHIHSFQSADSSDPVEYKVKGALADGLDIPVSSEHEWVVDFQPVIQKLGMTKWAFGVPSEELTTFTWGHFGVIPLRPREDRVNNGAIDWIGKEPPAFFQEVHEQDDKPLLIINHPSGGGFGAYFSSASFKRDTAKGSAKLWSDNFEAVEVYNDSDHDANLSDSVGDWFALLNSGKKAWAVGSSDSHKLRTSPVGYPRSCISFGHDDPEKLSPELVRDGVASGNLVVSGGLMMSVQGPNKEAPGQTLKVGDAEVTLIVDLQHASWVKAKELEVIVNGQVISTEALNPLDGAAGPAKHYRNEIKVKRDASKTVNWVVIHARGEGDLAPLHPGRKPFAVSNPIFLE